MASAVTSCWEKPGKLPGVATAAITRTHGTAGQPVIALWHLLSLDAPCVAAVWTCFLAHQFQLALPFTAPLALALAVWLLYAADRMLDAARGEAAEERHRFHHSHRRGFLLCATAGAVCLLFLVARLPGALRLGWLLLAVPLAVYVSAVHALQLRRFSKEPLVAIFFASAVSMPLLTNPGAAKGDALLSAAVFAGLCWLNCAAIARWERTLRAADAFTAMMGRHFAVAAGLGICFALPLLLSRHSLGTACAAMAAAALLVLVDQSGNHLPQTVRRALADAALLTPLIVWPLLSIARHPTR